MAGVIEKNYGNALYELVVEEKPDLLSEVWDELKAINSIIGDNPELIKFSGSPTVSKEEKLSVIEEIFKGKLTDYTYNFLMVLTEAGRLDYFDKICRYFTSLCNERFGIADITIVTTEPISDETREKLRAKMASVTGKKVNIKEEIDSSIIGGIVIKYGNRSFDGSVKARLDALKAELGSTIC